MNSGPTLISTLADARQDIVPYVQQRSNTYGLRSASSSKYETPRLRTKFGERAFKSRMPELLHGTHCHQTFVLQPALSFSRNYLQVTTHF